MQNSNVIINWFNKTIGQTNWSVSRIHVCIFVLLFFIAGCIQQEKIEELHLGDTAPDFAIRDLSGNVVVLSRLKGKPVVLRFFETGCRFCKADTPAFNAFYDRYRENGLQILYVGSFYDNEKSLRQFTRELDVDFPVAMDKDNRLADQYNILAYPQTLFIGPEQKILAAILGGVGDAELEEIIGRYFKNVEDLNRG